MRVRIAKKIWLDRKFGLGSYFLKIDLLFWKFSESGFPSALEAV